MQIIHHLFWHPTDAQMADLVALGFEPDLANGFLVMDVDEADPRWPAVRALANADAVATVYTRATDRERSAASWLAMHATGHHGYPQPEDDFGGPSYDRTAYCRQCGVGEVQRAAFRFRRDPKLRPRRLLQLNWVFDVFFTTPETWEQVFRPLGVSCREAVLHRSGAVLPSLVQLEALEAPAPLALGSHVSATCPRCGRMKYLPFTRGFLPAFAGPPPQAHLAVSREWFGSGARARHQVLVSAALYRAIRAADVRGVTFMPTQQPAASDAPAA